MATIDRIIRGIPAWLMGAYLQEMGAVEGGNGRYTHPQWSAAVAQIEDFPIGSLRIGQIHFTAVVDEAILDDFQSRLEIKLLRGGG